MKFTLRRERLNSGGYNSSGHYFGVGMPLFWCISADCKYEGMVRARGRDHAKVLVRERHPEASATFYK